MVEINELVIRVPAGQSQEGNNFGQEIAQRVAELLPDSITNRQLPELKVRMTASNFYGESRMAKAIAEQIIKEIKLAAL